MRKQSFNPASVAAAPPKTWSNVLRVDDMVFLSGMTARDLDGQTVSAQGEYEQAKVIFQKLQDLLEAAGGQMDDMVKMTIFVTNIANNQAIWKAREEFFTGDFPACSLVEVSSLAKPEILLEIEGMAVIGCSQ